MCDCYLKAELLDWSSWSKGICQAVTRAWSWVHWAGGEGENGEGILGRGTCLDKVWRCEPDYPQVPASRGHRWHRRAREGDARCLQWRAGRCPGATGELWEGCEQRRGRISFGVLEGMGWLRRLEAGRPGRRLGEWTESESSPIRISE